MQVSRSALSMLSVGVIVGALSTAGMLAAQRRSPAPAPVEAPAPGTFDLVDTPGSTFLLDRSTGEVWRIGFTEVRGERHWFGTFVPRQQPVAFEEFQQRLRRQLEGK